MTLPDRLRAWYELSTGDSCRPSHRMGNHWGLPLQVRILDSFALQSIRVCVACANSVATRLPLHHSKAYAIRPYVRVSCLDFLRSLRPLRLIIRFRTGPVMIGPYFVIYVLSVVKFLLRFGCVATALALGG